MLKKYEDGLGAQIVLPVDLREGAMGRFASASPPREWMNYAASHSESTGGNRHPVFSILLAVLSLVGIAWKALAQESLIPLLKRIQPAVVTVIAYDATGLPLQQGSGFFVSTAGHLVTNRHVLYGTSRAEVKTHDGRGYAVTLVVAEDKEGDLVRLVTDIPKEAVQELHITGVVPEVGERVVVVGSPLGLEQTVSDGLVSAVRDIPGFGTIVQLTAPISPGSSGSPVVNLKGEVIGIATLQLLQGQNLNFAIPGERVLALKPGKGQMLAEWTTGATRERVAEAEELYSTGLRFDQGENCAKALPYFEEAVQKNPRYAEAWDAIGDCNGMLRRWQDAVEAYKQAIRLKPDYAKAHAKMGQVYLVLYRNQEAIKAFKQAIRLEPNLALAHSGLGQTYGTLGRYWQALEAFKQAIRFQPDFALAYNGLGWTYNRLMRWQQAVAAYQQAIRLKPDDAEAHSGLGVAYGNLGHNQDALAAFQQAIRLKPDDAEAHYNLGVAYVALGNRGSALEEYKILKTLDQNLAIDLFSFIYQ